MLTCNRPPRGPWPRRWGVFKAPAPAVEPPRGGPRASCPAPTPSRPSGEAAPPLPTLTLRRPREAAPPSPSIATRAGRLDLHSSPPVSPPHSIVMFSPRSPSDNGKSSASFVTFLVILVILCWDSHCCCRRSVV
ncbi:unnamed protein product [Penicillium salamii]|uniref:Uncharacterized protein n=1 Tax=Penicillium salamii TaxID=1612424 RepID=A0A9W4JCF7_9EURO|nr:unnamed protein product [Penicillium salamii]